MTAERKPKQQAAGAIPLFGRDEMNLIEFPFGPITTTGKKTFEVEHPVFDKTLGREVNRRLLITGSDAFGLPRPIDDQVLLGMKALTYQAGFKSPKVEFSRYHLCHTLGWPTDGRSYKRLEESLDRIAGTTLKFKDSWWDKGEGVWHSKTFHLIESVTLTSRDQIQRNRKQKGAAGNQLSTFVWNEHVWKSFQDGYMKRIDMQMLRRISSGRRRELPVRLYRILDKRFYKRSVARFELRNLCVGILGLSDTYRPSELIRILKRASRWLVQCGYLREIRIAAPNASGRVNVLFIKPSSLTLPSPKKNDDRPEKTNRLLQWFRAQPEERQQSIEAKAVAYCQQKRPPISDGYSRNQAKRGPVFESYRDQAVSEFLRSRRRRQDRVEDCS